MKIVFIWFSTDTPKSERGFKLLLPTVKAVSADNPNSESGSSADTSYSKNGFQLILRKVKIVKGDTSYSEKGFKLALPTMKVVFS